MHASHFAALLRARRPRAKPARDGRDRGPVRHRAVRALVVRGRGLPRARSTGPPGEHGRCAPSRRPSTSREHPPRSAIELAAGSWGADGDYGRCGSTGRRSGPGGGCGRWRTAFWDVAPRALASPARGRSWRRRRAGLLLAQASDWQFIIITGAVERLCRAPLHPALRRRGAAGRLRCEAAAAEAFPSRRSGIAEELRAPRRALPRRAARRSRAALRGSARRRGLMRGPVGRHPRALLPAAAREPVARVRGAEATAAPDHDWNQRIEHGVLPRGGGGAHPRRRRAGSRASSTRSSGSASTSAPTLLEWMERGGAGHLPGRARGRPRAAWRAAGVTATRSRRPTTT